jgi:hypothetical protein
VKVMLSPPVLLPGGRITTESILTVRSETPVDYVSMHLAGRVLTIVGSGNARSTHAADVYAKVWRSEPEKLAKGERRYRVAFDLPADALPSYQGESARVTYTLTVHVSIPWWPDRVETFAVPVGFAHDAVTAPAEARPVTVATSTEGPRGTTPFLEVALSRTALAVGEVLVGSVSLANLRGRRVRGVDVAFVQLETLGFPGAQACEARRFALRVHDGAPQEGEAIPFRVRVPERATPTLAAPPFFHVTTLLEVRADVAWGEDVLLRTPLEILPAADGSTAVAASAWVAPVGRERRTAVWQSVCERTGLANDPDAERMLGSRGNVAVEIRTEQRDKDFWLVGTLRWPTLGLDLSVRELKWTDALTGGVIEVGDAKADKRFAVRAREPAQAVAVVTSELLRAFLPFGEVTIDDAHATVASRGSAHSTASLATFASAVLFAADAAGAAGARVPVPAVFAPHEPAWRALAERLHGRFEPGRMFIHDARLGTDAVSLGAGWGPGGALLGTTLHVAIDPPLPRVPASPEDPEVSPAARATWKELAAAVGSVRVDAAEIVCELPGTPSDPQTAMPRLELAVALRRALGGVAAAGPFR